MEWRQYTYIGGFILFLIIASVFITWNMISEVKVSLRGGYYYTCDKDYCYFDLTYDQSDQFFKVTSIPIVYKESLTIKTKKKKIFNVYYISGEAYQPKHQAKFLDCTQFCGDYCQEKCQKYNNFLKEESIKNSTVDFEMPYLTKHSAKKDLKILKAGIITSGIVQRDITKILPALTKLLVWLIIMFSIIKAIYCKLKDELDYLNNSLGIDTKDL